MQRPLRDQLQQRPGGRPAAVGRVLVGEGPRALGPGVEMVEHDHRAEDLHPGERAPVLVVAIDGERRLWAPPQEAHPRDPGSADALGLVVDGAVDPPAAHRVGDRQHAGAVAIVEQAEVADAAGAQQFVRPAGQLV